jgi:hypothetical protein
MGIDAQLREHDEILAEVGDRQMVLSRAARSSAFAQTRLLKYLEPWVDAMFNQAQANTSLPILPTLRARMRTHN